MAAVNIDPTGLLGDNARQVFEMRWSLRDDSGRVVETVEETMRRVAHCVADGASDDLFVANPSWDEDEAKDEILLDSRIPDNRDALEEAFMTLLKNMWFLPNSPAWTGAGTPLGQLAACFVLPIEDDMGESPDGIMSTLRNAVLIQKTGGGNGFSFSRLRPKGAIVSTTKGPSSGPIAFIKSFDGMFNAVQQGGVRRGANMAVLRVDHPDIVEFVKCKHTEGELTNFNVSVGITDAFMRAYEEKTPFPLVDPNTHEEVDYIDPVYLMGLIAECAHRNGEPGLLFLDTINARNPVPHLYELEATNPCGEQALGPYENCCLGSINLAHFTVTYQGEEKPAIDWRKLEVTIVHATLFLDCMVSANKYVPAVPQLAEAANRCRRIGLGVMGLWDILVKLGIRYGTSEASAVAARIMQFVRHVAFRTSIVMASRVSKFTAFNDSAFDNKSPNFNEKCIPSSILENEVLRDLFYTHGIRNAALTTIAPTGTLSTVAECEGYGCEPAFALAYTRNVVVTDASASAGERRSMAYGSPLFSAAVADAAGAEAVDAAVSATLKTGSCQGVPEVPLSVRNVFVTSGDISTEDHIRMQAALQEHVDNSISKTINMPASSTVQDVISAYCNAWESKCKGITVYVTGSRDVVVLETAETSSSKAAVPNNDNDDDDNDNDDDDAFGALARVPRPAVLPGVTMRGPSPIGDVLVTVNDLDGAPFEVIVTASKAGSETAAIAEAMGRLVSAILRMSGGPPRRERLQHVARQLSGIGGQRSVGLGKRRVRSLPDAIAHLLVQYNALDSSPPLPAAAADASDTSPFSPGVSLLGADLCPECGQATYVRTEGCVKCMSCGLSEC